MKKCLYLPPNWINLLNWLKTIGPLSQMSERLPFTTKDTNGRIKNEPSENGVNLIKNTYGLYQRIVVFSYLIFLYMGLKTLLFYLWETNSDKVSLSEVNTSSSEPIYSNEIEDHFISLFTKHLFFLGESKFTTLPVLYTCCLTDINTLWLNYQKRFLLS